MDSRDLSVRQLDALFDKLRPMAYYVAKVRKRMEQQRSPRATNWRRSCAKPRQQWCDSQRT
jgi:hypothetical protein